MRIAYRGCLELVLLIGLLPLTASPQSRISLPVNFLDHNSGLEDTHNFYFYKDSRNFVWISSWAGLHRFDGSSMRAYLPGEDDPYSIRGKSVQGHFQEDSTGNLWFTTSNSLNCFQRKTDRFLSFQPDFIERGNSFLVTLDSDHRLWLMAGDGLYTFDLRTQEFSRKASLPSCTDRLFAYKDRDGKVKYVFSFCRENQEKAGYDCLRFERDSLVSVQHLLGESPGFGEVVKDMYVDGDSLLWVACNEALYKINIHTADRQMFWPDEASPTMRLRAVERINDSLLLVATFGGGYFTFNSDEYKFRNQYELLAQEQILAEVPQSLYRDPDGGIWISVGYRGVAFFHPENHIFKHYRYDIKSPLSDSRIALNSMVEVEDGKVWGSSDKHGGVVFNGPERIESQVHSRTPHQLSEDATIMSYPDSKGRVWVLTESIPCLRLPGGNIDCIEQAKGLVFRSICELSPDSFILGSRAGGLYLFSETASNRFALQEIISVPGHRIYSFLWKTGSGKILGSTRDGLLDLIDPAAGFELRQSHQLNAELHCVSRISPDSTLWLGTDKGIYLYSEKMTKPVRYQLSECLPNMIVFSILPYTQNSVLLSSNKGIHLYNTKSGSCQNFTDHHGTGAPVFYRHSWLRHSTGQYWFGNSFGVTVLEPGSLGDPHHVSPVNLVSIDVNDEVVKDLQCIRTGAYNVSEMQAIELPYKKNTVSLKYAAVDYRGIGPSNFEYRLKGVEKNWIKSGNVGFARYSHLPPGKYDFEVRVAGLPYTARSLAINIITPFHMSWWFIALIILIALALVFIAIRNREIRKRKSQQIAYEKELALNEERLRIAHDVHDDLGSSISALGIRTRLIARQAGADPVRTSLESLSQAADSLTSRVRETIWTINSDNDSLDNLITRLHQYTLEYFENTAMDISVSLPEEQRTDSIPGEDRKNIYLAFKEALHNIQKHSAASKVRVRIFYSKDDHLHIEIKDNGRGFDLSDDAVSRGTGLHSMKRRMIQSGGQFFVQTGDTGTAILLTYPVNTKED